MKKRPNTQSYRKKVTTNDDHAWAVSYVDLLTLLLCFFVIFFNFKNNENGINSDFVLTRISKNFGSDGITKNGGSGSEGNSEVQTFSSETFEKISKTPFVNKYGVVSNRERILVIEIPNISFFPTGKKHLTSEGEKIITNIIDELLPFKEQIHVTVQGHTDPRPIIGKRIEDNWELSVLRASTVLKRFLNKGFESKSLSAEGLADTKREIASEGMSLSYYRRVTLKIREVKND
jgi:chemotaxis protein MotB